MKAQPLSFAIVSALALALVHSEGGAFTLDFDFGDIKTYPGAMCRPDNRSAFWPAIHSGGQTISISTSPSGGWVDCPVVRDVESAKTDALSFVQMKVKDPHSSQNVKCTFYSAHDNGTTVEFSQKSTAGQSNNVQTLSFATLDSASLGYYYFLCQLPPYENSDSDYARIISYSIGEKT